MLALKKDGSVWAWGNNYTGQLGTGSRGGENYRPAQVPGLDQVVRMASGDSFSLALRRDGSLWGWGGNMYGALGTQSATASPVLVRPATGQGPRL